MPQVGSTELQMLWLSIALGLVHLLAAVAPSVLARGMPWALGPRDEPGAPLGVMAGRLERAWKNFQETFPLFAAAILVASLGARDSDLGALGAQLYFWGRVAFLPLYALGAPVVRTLAWTVSMAGVVLVVVSCLPGI